MWRILQFSYKQAWLLILATFGLTAFFALQLPNLKIKVSADELIPAGSPMQEQYDKVRAKFGSDEVAVVYAQSAELFNKERLTDLKELNKKLKQLDAVERVESLFTVSNIASSGGMVDTSPLLQKIPKREKQLKERQDMAKNNPILLRNVISKEGDATTLTLYLVDQYELAEKIPGRIDKLKAQLEALGPEPEATPETETEAADTKAAAPPAMAPAGPAKLPAGPPKPATVSRPGTPAPPPAGIAPAPAPRGPPKPMGPPKGIPKGKKRGFKAPGGEDALTHAQIREKIATLERYLEPANFAPNVHEDIEKLVEQHRADYDELFQMGSPALQVEMTALILDDQKVLLPLSGVVLVILIGIMLQSVQGAIIPVLNAAISAAWTFGAMAILDVPVNMLNYIVPALILVIGATEDVHLLVEFKEALAEGLKGVDSMVEVGHKIGLTLALTGMTTVLGFAATGLTDIKIMRDFGITAALGMFARFIVSIVFLPAYLRIFGRFFKPASHEVHEKSWPVRATNAFTRLVMDRIVPYPIRSITTFLLIALPCAYFATHIKMSNDLISFLKPDSKLVTQLDTLSQNLSGTKVINLTLKGKKDDFKRSDNIKNVWALAEYLRGTGHFDTVTSLADYLALVNREMYEDEEYFTAPATDALLAQYLLFFHHSQIKPYVTGDYSQSNIVIRCNINDSHQLNVIVDEIIEHIDGNPDYGNYYIGKNATITGKSVMVAKSVQQLSTGQTASITFMTSILFVVIAALFISGKAASMAVIANLFSICVLFGIMGIAGIPLNVGTCMVAAITIGIGIDDTLHLMVRYNKELKVLKQEIAAIEQAVRAEFIPVLVTSMGLAGGFLVLASSSFVPVMQFGYLSAIVIFVAVVADLIVTPVLLSKTRLITLWDLVGLNLRKALMTTSPLFKGMTGMQAKKLILASDVREYEAGTKVISAGEEGDSMYVILEGDLEVSVTSGDKKILISYLSMGEVFGEIALISKSKRTADVIARSPSKLLVYDWDSLVRLRRYAPFLSSQLLLNLANILGLRLVDSQKKLEESKSSLAGSSPARKRSKL